MQKLDKSKLPAEVLVAYAEAEAWTDQRFQGRRTIPRPAVVSMPIEEEEGAAIYAILVPPGSASNRTIEKAALALAAARGKGGDAFIDALDKMHSIILGECCFWAGIPPTADKPAQVQEAAEDSRVAARAFLRSLQEEPGSLGRAFNGIANSVSDYLTAPEVSLGKL